MNRLFGLLLLSTLGHAESPSAARFSIGAIEVSAAAPASTDGRFSIRASARLDLTQTPAGRFQIKSTRADCEAPSLMIFANGFE